MPLASYKFGFDVYHGYFVKMYLSVKNVIHHSFQHLAMGRPIQHASGEDRPG